MQQRHKPSVDLTRLIQISCLQRVVELERFLRKRIGQSGNPTFGTETEPFKRNVVESSKKYEAVAEGVVDVSKAARIRRRFLHGNDVWLIRQPSKRSQIDVHPI